MGFFEWLFEPVEDVIRSIRDIWKENDSVDNKEDVPEDSDKESNRTVFWRCEHHGK